MARKNAIIVQCSAELVAWLESERIRREQLAEVPIPLSRVVVSILEAAQKEKP